MFLVKFSLLVAFGILILVGVGALTIFYLYQNKPQIQVQESISASPNPSPIQLNRSVQGTSSALLKIQPQSGSNTNDYDFSEIQIINPANNSNISSPVTVKGVADSLDLIIIKIKDQNGLLLGQGLASPCISVTPCLFEGSVMFDDQKTKTGYVEISNELSNKLIFVNF